MAAITDINKFKEPQYHNTTIPHTTIWNRRARSAMARSTTVCGINHVIFQLSLASMFNELNIVANQFMLKS